MRLKRLKGLLRNTKNTFKMKKIIIISVLAGLMVSCIGTDSIKKYKVTYTNGETDTINERYARLDEGGCVTNECGYEVVCGVRKIEFIDYLTYNPE